VGNLGNNLTPVSMTAAVVASGNATTTTGTEIDLQGFEGAFVMCNSGAEGDTLASNLKYEFKLFHGDTSGSLTAVSSQLDVTDAAIASDGTWLTLDDNAETPQVSGIGYVGGKRYIRVDIVRTGNHSTGTPLSITCIKGFPRHAGGASTYSLA
jgi:hypothetical protein